ncbi:MAG: methyltransferase, partial [Gammaproteobacteria bacterium]|nr:methyltransferase [Gammaproteobacteria bacterium]
PFHQQHATGDAVAWRMFNDAKKVLKKDGELWVVANRHLAYHIKLKKIFNNYEQIASNKKFVILKVVKR